MVGLLRDIASDNPRESFVEMMCLWFDDLYLPGHDPAPYTPEVWNRGIKEFNSCFHREELEALERFHELFDQRARRIPEHSTALELSRNADWQVIREGAVVALKAFESEDRRLEV
ncbi:MAG: hypothetical protein ACRD88_21145 [Terriglobia bacterium]